jgi:hypothetical protein
LHWCLSPLSIPLKILHRFRVEFPSAMFFMSNSTPKQATGMQSAVVESNKSTCQRESLFQSRVVNCFATDQDSEFVVRGISPTVLRITDGIYQASAREKKCHSRKEEFEMLAFRERAAAVGRPLVNQKRIGPSQRFLWD